jgi:hypothetical protein
MILDMAACDVRMAVLTRDTMSAMEDAVNGWMSEAGPLKIHAMKFHTDVVAGRLVYTTMIVHENSEPEE